MECGRTNARGWYRDPFGRHEDRYFSMGAPTKLVRDAGVESYDPPPRGARIRRPLEAANSRTRQNHSHGDMRRADDAQRQQVVDPCRKAFDAAIRHSSFG